MDTDIIVALLVFFGTIIPAYLLFRGEIAKVVAAAEQQRLEAENERARLQAELAEAKAEREAATRDDRREDFRAITDSQQAQIKQLQDMVAYLRGVAGTNERAILDLTRENGALREKLADLETRLARRELCPYAREGKCPLGLVAVTVDGKE